MADARDKPRKKSENDPIEEHEGLDADTVFEDVGELFRPDNTVIPPLNPDDPPGLDHSDEAMASEDVARGERPEQPVSSGHAAYERARTNQHPVGEEQAEINRSEDSPA